MSPFVRRGDIMTSQPCRLDPKGSNICKMKSTNQGLTDNEEKMIL